MKKTIVKIFLALLSLTIAVELSLRLILGLGSPLLFEENSAFGYFPQKNQSINRFFSHIETNNSGMRSRAFSEPKSPGEYRILFVGDSVAFGTSYVGQSHIFTEQIRQYFAERGKNNVSILNASSPGWAPSNELGWLKARGTYDADMVVMVYNTKDLNQPFAPYLESPLTPLKNPPLALIELWQRYLEPRLFPSLKLADPGSTGADGRPSLADETAVLQTVEDTWRAVTDHGAHFVILFTPAVTADVRLYQADWDQALQALKQWAIAHSVPVLDMTDAMKPYDPSMVYFDGIHLRPTGNSHVAQEFVGHFSPEIP